MYKYILNNNGQSNGDHEVHNASLGCSFLPKPENQIDLGYHSNCHQAVDEAKRRFPKSRINGCYYCCKDCHTS